MSKNKLNEKEKDTKNSIETLVNEADQCILISASRGNIRVTGIKNVNYSHEAKGLLAGAMDSYTLKPILQAINLGNQNTITQVSDLLSKPKNKKKDK